jgi:hypothetical protein
MDNVPFATFPFLLFGLTAGLVQLAWYIGVMVFLYKIWQKVKHLPG